VKHCESLKFKYLFSAPLLDKPRTLPFELYSSGQEKVSFAVNCYLQTGLGGGKLLAVRLSVGASV